MHITSCNCNRRRHEKNTSVVRAGVETTGHTVAWTLYVSQPVNQEGMTAAFRSYTVNPMYVGPYPNICMRRKRMLACMQQQV